MPDEMKTFWLRFHQNFTDYAEGRTLEEAVARLGMTVDDVAEWRTLHAADPSPTQTP